MIDVIPTVPDIGLIFCLALIKQPLHSDDGGTSHKRKIFYASKF